MPAKLSGRRLADELELYFRDLSARCTRNYLRRARDAWRTILRELGDPLLDELGAAALIDYRARRIDRGGVARATANYEVWHVQAYLRWLRELGRIGDHPALTLRPMRVREADRRRARRALGDEEVARLLRAALELDQEESSGLRRARIPQAPIWRLFVELGLRRGEACALTWGRVDFAGAVLEVEAASSKSGRSRRLPLSERVRRDLEDLARVHERFLGRAVVEGDPVLLTRTGVPWSGSPEKLNLALRALLKRARIVARGVSVHALRHTAASRLMRGGASPRVVQEILGHADVETTLAIYTHVEQSDVRRALEGVQGSTACSIESAPRMPATSSSPPPTGAVEIDDALLSAFVASWPSLPAERRAAALWIAGVAFPSGAQAIACASESFVHAGDAHAARAAAAGPSVGDVLHRLSARHRSVYELAIEERRPYAEVAQRLEVPVGTIKSRVWHVRRKLEAALAELSLEEGVEA